MNTPHKLIVLLFTLILSTVGYAANNEEGDSSGCAAMMGKSEHMPGMMGGTHGGSMRHQDMSRHHMMQPGVSPVTIMIQPGMMPMMNQNKMHHQWQSDHNKHDQGKDNKQRHHDKNKRDLMRKEHMEKIEQRLENIEALLAELVELQKNG